MYVLVNAYTLHKGTQNGTQCMKLNDRQIKSLKWDDKDSRVCVGNGLYLNIRKNSKTWIVRSRRNGITSVKTLKTYPEMSLREAMAEASRILVSPDRSKVTVNDLSVRYLSDIVEKKHKRPELAQGYFKRAVLPALGSKKVQDVTRFELANLIREYAKRGKRSADQLRSNLKGLFGYGVELGLRDDNPVSEMTCRVSGYEAKARERVLTDKEIALLWGESHPNARVLRFLLLTGVRISEARNGYQDKDRWIVPGEISKNGRAHWVHLTEQAKLQLPFPKTTPTNTQAWTKRWCEKHGVEPRFTPHDLRRTAATRMADNQVTPFVVEKVLNHTLQGVMGVYNRAEYEDDRIEASKKLEEVLLDVVSHGGVVKNETK